MYSFSILGYVSDAGLIWCESCGDSGDSPIFADSEWDSEQHCEHCGCDLEVNVISVD